MITGVSFRRMASMQAQVTAEVDGVDGAVEGFVAAVGACFPASAAGIGARRNLDFGEHLLVEVVTHALVPVHASGAVAGQADASAFLCPA